MLFSRSYVRSVGFFYLNADKGEFGFGTGTQKEQLATAKQEKAELEGKLEKEEKAHAATKTKLSEAETARDGLKTQFETESKGHAETKTKLTTVEAERDTLKATDKTAEGKAKEQLAKQGIQPAAKDAPGNLEGNNADPIALWESYAKADSVEQARMRAKHGEKLDAAAAAFDAAQKAK